jgi:nitrate/TMAO reductase-like tetraheme cytochrome c subunit
MREEEVLESLDRFFDRHPGLFRWLKRLAKAGVLFFFLGLIGGYSLLKYSEKPEFCKSCHYMVPFYEAWKRSSHNHVRCVECHYAPGVKEEVRSKWEALSQVAKYVTGTYGTKPWAEISDRSCLRSGCHDKRLLRGKVAFGNVVFDHASHLTELRRGKRLRCTSCHSQIVQGEHMTVTTTTCIICHFKGQKEGEGMARCTLCHSPPSEPVEFQGVTIDHKDAVRMGIACTKCHLKMTRGTGDVPKERCYSCHLKPERVAKYDDSILLHDVHITEHKVECTACHLEMEHRITTMTEAVSLDCNSCHPDHHKAQKELYMGIGGKGVPHSPDPMFLTRVECEGCHIAHEGNDIEGYTRKAPSAACMSCHGTRYGKMLEQWERKMGRSVELAKKARDRVARALERAEKAGRDTRRVRPAFESASYNVNLVDYGKGVHNVRYSQQLLVAAMDSLRAVVRLLGAKIDLPELERPPAALRSGCYQCHFGMKAVVQYGDESFPHELHVSKRSIPCTQCHSDDRHPGSLEHGRLAFGAGGCADCHHRSEVACERCHPLQGKVYRGQVAGLPKEGDFMAQAGVDCEGCHTAESDRVARPTGRACATCHDEDYASLKQEWQEEVRSKAHRLEKLLDRAEATGRVRKLGAEARRYRALLETVRSDGSWGVHNFQLLDGQLSEAIESLQEKLGSGT